MRGCGLPTFPPCGGRWPPPGPAFGRPEDRLSGRMRGNVGRCASNLPPLWGKVAAERTDEGERRAPPFRNARPSLSSCQGLTRHPFRSAMRLCADTPTSSPPGAKPRPVASAHRRRAEPRSPDEIRDFSPSLPPGFRCRFIRATPPATGPRRWQKPSPLVGEGGRGADG
jgi:hypothetical protein